MDEFSILIGGKAGFGIDKASYVIADIFNSLGYRSYIYRDYPSLIRGGHTFSIIRVSRDKKAAHTEKIDLLLAMNQDCIDLHKGKLSQGSVVIYDSDSVKAEGIGISLGKITREITAPDITRNSGMIGAMCRAVGLDWPIVEKAFRDNFSKELDANLKIARIGYDSSKECLKIAATAQNKLPLNTGNEAVGLGLVKAGLKSYIAYPMTPSSPILHFLAGMPDDAGIQVIHPESEIAVILMALGFSYCGKKAAVGTSGGGFCLMTEGLSFSAMAELPVVIVLGQRPGPSTGLPTYSAQTELDFALSAGQGEFVRFVVTPGDAEEAYYWSAAALNMSWKYQIPSIILTDKTLGEGTYSFDMSLVKDIKEEPAKLWDRKTSYKRYLDTKDGVSGLAFASDKDAVVKINSYEHDEAGITTEDSVLTVKMQDKRLRKERSLIEELENYEMVKVYGKKNSATAILCWGSNKGVCVEAAGKLGLKVVQPLVLSPFPGEQLKKALKGVKRIIAVENNATAQLAGLLKRYAVSVDDKILKYDGRPFSLDELLLRFSKIKI